MVQWYLAGLGYGKGRLKFPWSLGACPVALGKLQSFSLSFLKDCWVPTWDKNEKVLHILKIRNRKNGQPNPKLYSAHGSSCAKMAPTGSYGCKDTVGGLLRVREQAAESTGYGHRVPPLLAPIHKTPAPSPAQFCPLPPCPKSSCCPVAVLLNASAPQQHLHGLRPSISSLLPKCCKCALWHVCHTQSLEHLHTSHDTELGIGLKHLLSWVVLCLSCLNWGSTYSFTHVLMHYGSSGYKDV